MASAQKLPSGAWRTRATKIIDGKQVRKSFTVTPDNSSREASTKAKAKSEMMARNWLFDMTEETKKTTVERAMQSHLEAHSAVWSPSTAADYKNIPKYFDSIKHMNALEVDSKTLQSFINQWAFDVLKRQPLPTGSIFSRMLLSLPAMRDILKSNIPKRLLWNCHHLSHQNLKDCWLLPLLRKSSSLSLPDFILSGEVRLVGYVERISSGI